MCGLGHRLKLLWMSKLLQEVYICLMCRFEWDFIHPVFQTIYLQVICEQKLPDILGGIYDLHTLVYFKSNHWQTL